MGGGLDSKEDSRFSLLNEDSNSSLHGATQDTSSRDSNSQQNSSTDLHSQLSNAQCMYHMLVLYAPLGYLLKCRRFRRII